jgi:copper chaperone CopZ
MTFISLTLSKLLYFREKSNSMTIKLLVQNLKCGGCAHTIKTALDKLDGISSVSVDTDQSTVTFDYQNSQQFDSVRDKLNKLGYPLAEEENDLLLKARSFVSCAKGRLA